MAVILKEVEHSDFNQIHQLFVEIYGKKSSPGFKKAFFDHDQLLGFCLIDDKIDLNPIVGYFGCFTYNRTINSLKYKFYNSHTWIVKEDYRKHSLKLLMSFMRLKDGMVTNFSANGKVAQILEQLKFEKISVTNTILKTSYSLDSYLAQRKIKRIALETDVAKWHETFIGLSLNLKLPYHGGTIEMVLKPVDKKPAWAKRINKISKFITKRPVITREYFLYKVHYINNPNMLRKNLNMLSHYLFFNEKVGGLIIPQELIKNLSPKHIHTQYEDVIHVKFNGNNIPTVDYLYSEVFYLNIVDK